MRESRPVVAAPRAATPFPATPFPVTPFPATLVTVLAATLLMTSPLAAQPDVATADAVRLAIVDASTGRPLPDATVLVVHRADTLRVAPDASGIARVARSRAAADATLVLRHLGYAPIRRSFAELTGGTTAPVRVALTPVAISLDATVVTAARREQRLADAVVPTEVITRRQIEETGATELASVLTEQLGIQLDQGLPGSAGVQLQGLGSQRVLVLVDGQPLVGRINGALDVSRLSTGNVERVEVVKGPQSTLYGSDAMGGVINVVTRRASDGRVEAQLQAIGGSQARRDLTGTVLAGHARGDARLELGLRDQALAPGVSNEAGTFATRYDVAPGVSWRASNALTVETGGLFTGERQRYRTGPLFRFVDRDQLAARVGATYASDGHRVGVLLYRSRFDHLARASTFDTPQGDLGDRDRQQLTELEVTYNGTTPLGTLDAGLELRRESIVADRVTSVRRTWDLVEPFAQLTVLAGPVAITPGVRTTRNSQWGNAVAPRLAVLWQASETVRLRASAGRGFRAPDFKELFLAFANVQAGYAVRGNADLRPETSTSVQLHAERIGARSFVRASVFGNRLADFIEFIATDVPGEFTYGNVARAWTRGADVEAGFTSGRWRVEGGYSHLATRDLDRGVVLLGRPAHSGRLGVSAGNLWGARVAATLVHTGRTPTGRDANGAESTVQPAFTRLDLRVARPLVRGMELSLGADNVFDRAIGPDWPGFTGRRVYGGVMWQPMGAR